jgi:hypothetical protein
VPGTPSRCSREGVPAAGGDRRLGRTAAFQVAQAYAYLGEVDRAFEWLDRAYAQRDPDVTHSAKDELFSALHGNPWWQAQLQRMRLEWRMSRWLPLIPP